ncbi:DUF6108 family protein [Prevotella sp.]|jgi:hypothetical protein|uniref:DUF6108 family protein n=1 Tax=uncultured Prevotella sp. TaxID=159272 RepID=UPI002627D8F2|nr:DUF6108 family protein [uncultured Prevotella sp.]
MKQFFVKRIMVTLAIMVACTITAAAQEGLNVDRVFQRFGKSKGCKMVVMKNTELRGYKLHTYKSLVYKNLYSAIEPYLAADKKSAKKVREVVEEGRIVSGYYMMAPLRGGINRYILFSNVGGHKGTVIYIEGTLSPDDIMKLCYSKV